MTTKQTLGISPAALRKALEQLGPTFVKIGQYLSLRPDLIPQEYCDELLKLVDSGQFFPYEAARRILIEDLGLTPEARFAYFDPQPVAAASLAQVYRAQTHGGHLVAVKVQREDIRESVRKDLARARLVGPLIDLFQLLPAISVHEALDEIERWMLEELDFELERRNIKQMYALSQKDTRVKIPLVFDELSGPRVITMEYLDGVPFSTLLRLMHEGRPASIAELGFDRGVLAENLLHTCLEQTFRYEFFHADMHPGNLIALPNNVIGFVDFGLTETLEIDLRPGVRRFIAAAYADDVNGMLAGLMELLIPEEGADPQSFRREFIEEHRIYSRRTRPEGSPRAGDSPLSSYMIGIMRAARKCRLRLPASLLAMYRSLLTAETIANQLGGTADLMAVGRNFFVGLQFDRLINRLQPGNIQQTLIPYLELMEESPDKYLRVMSDIAEGRFVLSVESFEAAATQRNANQRTKLVSAAIVFVGISMLMQAAIAVRLFGRVSLNYFLGLLLAAVLVWLIVLWRRLE